MTYSKLKAKPGQPIWCEISKQFIGRNTLNGTEDHRFTAKGHCSMLNGFLKTSKWRPQTSAQVKAYVSEFEGNTSNDYILKGYGLILDCFTLETDQWIVTAAERLGTNCCGITSILKDVSSYPKVERESKLKALQRLFLKEIKVRDLKLYSELTAKEEALKQHRKQIAAKNRLVKSFEKRLDGFINRQFKEHEDWSHYLKAGYSSIVDYIEDNLDRVQNQLYAMYCEGMPYGDTNIWYGDVEKGYNAYIENTQIEAIDGFPFIVAVLVHRMTPEQKDEFLNEYLKQRERNIAWRAEKEKERKWKNELRELESKFDKDLNELMNRCPLEWKRDVETAHKTRKLDFRSEEADFIERYLKKVYGDTDAAFKRKFSSNSNPISFWEFKSRMVDKQIPEGLRFETLENWLKKLEAED